MANKSCPIFGKCGGCKYINQDYREQLNIKLERVRTLLKDFGRVESIIGMDYPYHYRNKVNAAFRRKKNGEII